ncbi:MAG: hypothetical protein IJ572_02050 [Bacilli bacterium]|nr:hypothetical protein [Bacilli bacterium]
MRSSLKLANAKLDLEKINYLLEKETDPAEIVYLEGVKDYLEYEIDYLYNNMCDHIWYVHLEHDDNYLCQCIACGKIKDLEKEKFGNRVIFSENVKKADKNSNLTYDCLSNDFRTYKEKRNRDYAEQKILKRYNRM